MKKIVNRVFFVFLLYTYLHIYLKSNHIKETPTILQNLCYNSMFNACVFLLIKKIDTKSIRVYFCNNFLYVIYFPSVFHGAGAVTST